jgi:dUTP pyrophosphatase
MEKEEIKNYIEQLKNFEQEIGSEDDNDEIDFNFIDDLNGLLSKLNTDVQQSMSANISALQIKVKKLNPNAVIPSYSKDGDAGMDLTITEIINHTNNDVTYGFGIAMEIPKGYVGLIFPRSSIRKYDLLLTNAVGVIDSGYRGEIQATFKIIVDDSPFYNKYEIGERGAQIIILPYPQIKFVESDTLSDTDRGEGGFGSTGV